MFTLKTYDIDMKKYNLILLENTEIDALNKMNDKTNIIQEMLTIFPIGAIIHFTNKEKLPSNFLPCDGRSIEISKYSLLYNIIGTKFNILKPPDGYFSLPDLRGKFITGSSENRIIGLNEKSSTQNHNHKFIPDSHKEYAGAQCYAYNIAQVDSKIGNIINISGESYPKNISLNFIIKVGL